MPLRRTREYEAKRSGLTPGRRLALDLAEESVVTDPVGTYRRELSDGTIVDLSSFDSDGVILIFTMLEDGSRLFIDFEIR